MNLRYLERGCTGTDVKNIQLLLNYHLPRLLPPLVDDEIFGKNTDARVCEFQRLNNLDIDGVVGPESRKKLLELVRVYGKIQIFSSNETSGSKQQFASLNNISRASTIHAAQTLFPRPALVDFGGQTTFTSLSSLNSSATNDKSTLVVSAERDGFSLKLVHELKLDLSLLHRNDSEEDNWLKGHIEYSSGQPSTGEWSFKAEVQAEPFKSLTLGPFELSGFGKGSLDLDKPAIDLGLGGELKMSIIRDRSGKEIIGLGVEGGAKLTWEPPAQSLKLGCEAAGQFIFRGRF